MKKIIFLGILIFILSVGIGYMYSSYLNSENIEKKEVVAENEYEVEVKEAVFEEEKVMPSTEFAVKEYYDECGHFKFEYNELPKELINFTEQEIEDYYEEDYEVEEFSKGSLIISKEINGFCDNHFLLKLENNYIVIYKLNTDGSYLLYNKTEISKEYLTLNDIEKLEEGIFVYGEGKVNATLEDFE